MLPGEQWRHRQTGELVRIEVRNFGLLSFSVLRNGQWMMCRHVWDEDQFREDFELQAVARPKFTKPDEA